MRFSFFPMSALNPQDQTRLQKASILWLATVRPNGAPHLVPIWFVARGNTLHICTARASVKARNIAGNARVVIALEDGSAPLVAEGAAKILDDIPPQVAADFKQKYDWEIQGDAAYDAVIEINLKRVVL